VTAAKKHNKVLGLLAADETWSRSYWAKGFRIFAVGVDAHLLQAGIRQGLRPLHELSGRA
jgi:2-keto-3-deoxy-L-rhamnonate aldolase RhmA